MPDFRPALASTTTSAPRPTNFFTVSGVAATRPSSACVSAGTAMSIVGHSWRIEKAGPARGRSGEKLRHADEDHDNDDQRPLGEGEKVAVCAFVLEKVRGWVSTLDLAAIDHQYPLQKGLAD